MGAGGRTVGPVSGLCGNEGLFWNRWGTGLEPAPFFAGSALDAAYSSGSPKTS